MIIDNSYFIDEIFIPHAKPSISDDVTAVEQDITSFINVYSQEALKLCLGYALYKEFSEQLDPSKENGLKASADEKWDKLLNGTEYTDQSEKLVEWKGIRFKTLDKYNKSFLADYVYYFYEQSNNDDVTGVGNVQQLAKNAVVVPKTPKVIFAWRRFVKTVQGESIIPTVYNAIYPSLGISGIGVDWCGQNEEVSLYKFIYDANAETADTYKDFNPHMFATKNQFGI